MTKNEIALSTVMVVGSSVGLFTAFCPDWYRARSGGLRKDVLEPGKAAAFRQGELIGGTLILAQGWAVARLTGNITPLYVAMGMTALLVGVYEWSVLHPAGGA